MTVHDVTHGRAGDHALPAVLDRLDAAVVEREVRLVVHAVEALDDGLLKLVDHLGPLTGNRVDAVDALVVNLYFELLGPAAITAQPGPDRPCQNPPYASIRRPAPVRYLAPATCLLLLAGCGDAGPTPEEQARSAVTEFGRATVAKDYRALCDRILAPALVEQVSSIGLPCQVALKQGLGSVRDPRLTIGRVQVDGEKASVEVRTAASPRDAVEGHAEAR